MKNNAIEFRMNRARLAGVMRGYTPAEFKDYLLEIGLNRYEKMILPVETEGEYPAGNFKLLNFPKIAITAR